MGQQVSDLIVERLITWGIDTIFGFPAMAWMASSNP
jgi:thiamine pyrophosphate-dependent acetolactate synthase large subunit-like protein